MIDIKIGKMLKETRKKKGITLQQLSEATELSVSYLSLMERGLNSPTINNLQKICKSLNTTMTEIIINIESNRLLVRKNERREVFGDHKGVLYEAITEGDRNIKGICMTVYDNESHDSVSHVADEFGFIVKGSMEVDLEGEIMELFEGDTLYIPSNTPHSFKKTSKEDCVTLWAHEKAQ